jgi:formylglycine-generating enzyme required for sulfatase activity
MGSDPKKDGLAQDAEQPQHNLSLPGFWMARYPVTVAQYRAFVDDSGYQTKDPDSLRGVPNHPVVGVTWHDALAYCDWLTGRLCDWPGTPEPLKDLLKTGGRVSLPSEAEWEKAARFDPDPGGKQGRIYPWGDAFDAERANTAESKIINTSAVGSFPGGASPYGIQDLCGNVWEWTRSLWGKDWTKPAWKYPYELKNPRRENLRAEDDILRVLRGGAWCYGGGRARCACRYWYLPYDWLFYFIGFRVVILPPSALGSEASDTLREWNLTPAPLRSGEG